MDGTQFNIGFEAARACALTLSPALQDSQGLLPHLGHPLCSFLTPARGRHTRIPDAFADVSRWQTGGPHIEGLDHGILAVSDLMSAQALHVTLQLDQSCSVGR